MATRTLARTGFQAVDILVNQVPKRSTFSLLINLRNNSEQVVQKHVACLTTFNEDFRFLDLHLKGFIFK